MSYSNEFLRNFRPVFLAILKAQSFRPERVCVGRTGGGERNVSDPEGNPGF